MIKINTQISGSIFGGFQTTTAMKREEVDQKTISEFHNFLIDDIIAKLKTFTREHNLYALQDQVKELRYHIHSHDSLKDISRALEKNETIYICDCHPNE